MEIADALGVLGLTPPCAWEDVRQAYRDQLMAHHPDTADAQASDERTAAIVAAFRSLRTLTDDGLRPLPTALADDGLVAPMILYARPGDVFTRLYQAAEAIGHVSYADADAAMLQVTVSSDEWAASQLTIELAAEGTITTAMFSLESLGAAPAPPIADVVQRIADQLRAPAALD